MSKRDDFQGLSGDKDGYTVKANLLPPEQWDEIKKTHPQIATKVMDLIVFEQDEVPSCKRIRTEECHNPE